TSYGVNGYTHATRGHIDQIAVVVASFNEAEQKAGVCTVQGTQRGVIHIITAVVIVVLVEQNCTGIIIHRNAVVEIIRNGWLIVLQLVVRVTFNDWQQRILEQHIKGNSFVERTVD